MVALPYPASDLVDREFVRAMSSGQGGEKVINAIIALAQSLGLTVVAEGASELREVRRLLDFGCRYVQGFFFSQAVPFESALAMLRQPAQQLGERFREVAAAWLVPPSEAADAQARQGQTATSSRLTARIGKWFNRN